MADELDKYGKLLETVEWQQARIVVADRANFRCEKCGKYLPMRNHRPTGEAHHTCYTAEYPWLEPLSNLRYLCHQCHEKEHGREFGWLEGYVNTMSCDSAVNIALTRLRNKKA